MRGRLIVIFSMLYGAIIAIAYHIHSIQVYESGLYLLNFAVEAYVVPPILLYFANDVGDSLGRNEILGFRIIFSVMFWGGISLLAIAGGKAIQLLKK